MSTLSKEISRSIQQYEFKSGLTQEFEIVDFEKLYHNSRELLATPHRSGFYHILWTTENSATHHIDFSPLITNPGNILFIHKDMVKQFDPTTVSKGKLLLFTDAFFSTQEHHSHFLNTTVLFNDYFRVAKIERENNLLKQIFNQIEEEFNQSFDQHKSIILRNLLQNLLMHCERLYRKNHLIEINKGTELNILISFKKLLEENYRENKIVSFYSSWLNITEKKLSQCTFQTIGKTPKEMVNERVILEAKRLLAHTDLNIKEIGFYLGFDEATNFVKFFKKITHTTPMLFRKLYR